MASRTALVTYLAMAGTSPSGSTTNAVPATPSRLPAAAARTWRPSQPRRRDHRPTATSQTTTAPNAIPVAGQPKGSRPSAPSTVPMSNSPSDNSPTTNGAGTGPDSTGRPAVGGSRNATTTRTTTRIVVAASWAGEAVNASWARVSISTNHAASSHSTAITARPTGPSQGRVLRCGTSASARAIGAQMLPKT
jgi:hypothetical protein